MQACNSSSPNRFQDKDDNYKWYNIRFEQIRINLYKNKHFNSNFDKLIFKKYKTSSTPPNI